jgi:hypothetical protein
MYINNKMSALKNLDEIIKELPLEQQGKINMDAFFTAVNKAVTLPNEAYFSKVCKEQVMSELYRLFITGVGSETNISSVLLRAKTNVDNYYKNLVV